MTEAEIIAKLPELLALPAETEWVEFKHNNSNPQEIGEYISSLSNSACLHKKDRGYLIFGVENDTHRVIGTTFNPAIEKKGNEALENWICHLLDPKIDFKIFQLQYQGKGLVVFCVDPANERPVKFSGTAYIRVGSYQKKLSDHPEKERKIWDRTGASTFEKGCGGRESLDQF
ncbi:MAG: ATP-binding protein [Elusimicrobia bacterium]|nr:ATP-binding protein [Elusimicrobiota bacterium]